jgi:dsRNA-specific ribonuclease
LAEAAPKSLLIFGGGWLGEAVALGKGEETTGGRSKTSILSDALEAVIGAVAFECCTARALPVVRVGLDALAAHFARPQRERFAIVRDRVDLAQGA